MNVVDDLERLFKSEPSIQQDESSTTELCNFSIEYPVLFELLHCSFGWMPSATRLVEQTHGGNRNHLHAGHTYTMMDVLRRYNVNEDYGMKEERRRMKRQESSSSYKSIVSAEELTNNRDSVQNTFTYKSKGSQKCDRTKDLQIFQATQMIKFGRRYKQENIAKIPSDVQKESRVRRFAKKNNGSESRNIVVRKQKQDHKERKKSKRKRSDLSLQEYKTMAKELKVDNDLTFEKVSEEDKEKRRHIDHVLRVTFWNNLAVSNGYNEKIKRTFKMFWQPEMKTMSKKDLSPKLSKYITILKDIKNGKFDNVFGIDKEDLQEKGEYDRMGFFIECDYLSMLFGVDTKRNILHKRERENIFKMNGQNIPDRKRYKMDTNSVFDLGNVSEDDESTCSEDEINYGED